METMTKRLNLSEFQESIGLDEVMSTDEIRKVVGGNGSGSMTWDDLASIIDDLMGMPFGGYWQMYDDGTSASYGFSSTQMAMLVGYVNASLSGGGSDLPTESELLNLALAGACLPQQGSSPQIGQMCTAETFVNVIRWLTQSDGYTLGNFMMDYLNTIGSMFDPNVGLVGDTNYIAMLNAKFHWSDCHNVLDVRAALLLGYPLIGTLNGNHSVMITGMDNGVLTFFDPATGNYATSNLSSFTDIEAILSVKD